ncbi:hypothetical protein ACFFF5_06775 [Lederbergia wuyishanensis]|uniref:DnaJ-class molecular chaperone n=1 Tax=Lederbergia wuyishanensis TaxID=1347903 RepID=A0ABU0D2Q3_9BACI|nr:hypothetical protein [Lederbergia wuyishanensis]MCJ8007195.1 hypothetical protein [Lederbergia wuyishanensis]MDQ0342660.1 DnaJ-class molecular chaperone [Lederbergia wuyishanensis]
MDFRDNHCKACHGTGMLADDEGWQYKCSVCSGAGFINEETSSARIMEVDENNRLLD